MIRHAIETDEPQLRYPVSWSANEVIDGRTRMTDDQWVALGRTATLDEYMAMFHDLFDVDLRT